MGWNFRRSIKLGPIRLNIGKRGVGTSIGGPFGTFGRSADGRTYRTFRIPGTGISYRESGTQAGGATPTRDGTSPGCGCLGVIVLLLAGTVAVLRFA